MSVRVSTSTRIKRQRLAPSRSYDGILPPILLGLAVVSLWWFGADLADSSVIPTPTESVKSLVSDLGTARFRGSIVSTVAVLAMAFLAAVAVGAATGLLVGLSAFWSKAILPVAYVSNTIPKIMLFPIFLLFLGIGGLSTGAFAFVTGVLPMFLIAAESTAAVQRLHLKLAASLGLSRVALIRKIVIPSILPSLVSGMRLSFGLTFLGVLIAEMFSGSAGLGYELLRNVSLVRIENIVGEVLLITILALIPTLALQAVERRVVRRFSAN